MAFFGLVYYVLQSFTRNRPNFKIPRSSSMRTPSPPGIGSPMHNKPLGVSSTPGSFQVNKQGKNRKNNSLIAYSSPRHSVWKLLKKVQIILQYFPILLFVYIYVTNVSCLFTFTLPVSADCLPKISFRPFLARNFKYIKHRNVWILKAKILSLRPFLPRKFKYWKKIF